MAGDVMMLLQRVPKFRPVINFAPYYIVIIITYQKGKLVQCLDVQICTTCARHQKSIKQSEVEDPSASCEPYEEHAPA